MKVKRRNLAIFLPLALIWLCALCYASINDLDISLAIADNSSGWGRSLEILGEPPAMLFAAFNFVILTAYRLRCTEHTLKNKLLAALFSIMSVGLPIYASINAVSQAIKRQNELNVSLSLRIDLAVYIIFIFGALLITALFALIAFTMKEERLKRFAHIAGSCAAAAVATFFIIWALKLCWGRIRFRNLTDVSDFTPWYLPQGLTGGFSFPSGHTANATVIVSIVHYLSLLPKRLRAIKPIACAMLGIWIVTVALSRVAVGAHYLSDVLFGMAITLVIVYFTRPRKAE